MPFDGGGVRGFPLLEEIAMPSPLVFVVISGACMTGTVNHGQTYAVDTSVPFASLRVGDVITFKLGQR